MILHNSIEYFSMSRDILYSFHVVDMRKIMASNFENEKRKCIFDERTVIHSIEITYLFTLNIYLE